MLSPLLFLGTAFSIALVPLTLWAATPGNFADFVGIFIGIINSLIPLVFGLALLAFLWGLSMLIFYAGDAAKRSEGKQIMIWGVIALFVMVSVWGLVNLLKETFF